MENKEEEEPKFGYACLGDRIVDLDPRCFYECGALYRFLERRDRAVEEEEETHFYHHGDYRDIGSAGILYIPEDTVLLVNKYCIGRFNIMKAHQHYSFNHLYYDDEDEVEVEVEDEDEVEVEVEDEDEDEDDDEDADDVDLCLLSAKLRDMYEEDLGRLAAKLREFDSEFLRDLKVPDLVNLVRAAFTLKIVSLLNLVLHALLDGGFADAIFNIPAIKNSQDPLYPGPIWAFHAIDDKPAVC